MDCQNVPWSTANDVAWSTPHLLKMEMKPISLEQCPHRQKWKSHCIQYNLGDKGKTNKVAELVKSTVGVFAHY